MPSFYMNAPDCICSPGRLPLGAFCAGRDDLEREALHDDRISIRAPRAGRDQAAATKKGFMSEFQSTRPVWGATRSPMWRSCSSRYFNPRAPCGARRVPRPACLCSHQISIHAPRVGRDDAGLKKERTIKMISIHAPRVGRDDLLCQSSGALSYFNPRAPCGARLVGRKKMHKKWDNFNPRAPCGARRYCGIAACHVDQHFNPRAPCGARPKRLEPLRV